MKGATQHHILIGDRHIDYRVVRSAAARKLRVRVGPNGVEVVQPTKRSSAAVADFLGMNASWILDQLRRVERMRGVRRPELHSTGEIFFRGEPTRVRIEPTTTRARRNEIALLDNEIIIRRSDASPARVSRSLENWLRKMARAEITRNLAIVCARLRRSPGRVYVMGQRTKWGNCSAQRNLSFNWRLILAPEFVLRYLVVHEAIHLSVPHHTAKFWLTVQSFCPESEKAKQWLRAHQTQLIVDLQDALTLP